MDLGAYANIPNLGDILKANGLSVPRLRGLRLMKDELPLSKDEIREEAEASVALEVYWDNKKYVIPNPEGWRIAWNKLHGKNRNDIKFYVKKAIRNFEKQYGIWNGYCGRDDVLYIHSRLGGSNWDYYDGDELTKQPWFLCKVDDAFDSTYCDIYAKIRRTDEVD